MEGKVGPGGGSLGTRACVRPRGAGETRLGTAVRGPGTATRTSGDKALPDRREGDGVAGGEDAVSLQCGKGLRGVLGGLLPPLGSRR